MDITSVENFLSSYAALSPILRDLIIPPLSAIVGGLIVHFSTKWSLENSRKYERRVQDEKDAKRRGELAVSAKWKFLKLVNELEVLKMHFEKCIERQDFLDHDIRLNSPHITTLSSPLILPQQINIDEISFLWADRSGLLDRLYFSERKLTSILLHWNELSERKEKLANTLFEFAPWDGEGVESSNGLPLSPGLANRFRIESNKLNRECLELATSLNAELTEAKKLIEEFSEAARSNAKVVLPTPD